MCDVVFRVEAEEADCRLDKLVSLHCPSLSRASVQKLLSVGAVTVNGAVPRKSCKPKAGDLVVIKMPEPQSLDVQPQPIPLDIVYEDDALLVVNKPKGMVVHPAPGNPDGTLVNALLYHCEGALSGINGVLRPGIVHRIDKDTSGLLVVAKTDRAHASLAAQLAAHALRREYRAVVTGAMPADSGTVDLPLGRSPHDRKKQAVNGLNPRRAVTHYEVLERYPGYSYCRFVLETGRTHQIRVHSACIGHPVAGDTVYGNPKRTDGLQGQCLHAAVLGFIHPVSGQYMEYVAALPPYFTAFLEKLQKSI